MNHAPDFAFWWRLLAWLAGEVALLIAFAAIAAPRLRPAAWRRTLWQVTFVALGLIVVAELTGLGRQLVPSARPPSKSAKRFVVRGNLPADARLGESAAPLAPLPPAQPDVAGRMATAPGIGWWPGWLWVAGCGLLLARCGAAWLLLGLAGGQRGKVSEDAVLQAVASLRRRLGLRRRVRVLEFPGLRSPIAFGVLRPAIGLPGAFTRSFSAPQREAMLAHELAHLAAGDPFWHGFAELITAALWWHPLLWWARRQLHAASESAADEASLVVDGGPSVLAGCLVELGRRLQQRRALGWLGVEGGGYRSGLGRRVERLLQLEGARWHPANGLVKTAMLAGACVVAGLTVVASTLAADDGQSTSLVGALKETFSTNRPTPEPGESTRPAAPRVLVTLDDKRDAATLVQDGRLLFEMGKLPEAEARLRRATQLDPGNQAAAYYLKLIDEVQKARASRADSPPKADPSARTNPPPARQGRQLILRKLERIRLDRVSFDDVSLGQVLRVLSDEAERRDPAGGGLSLVIAPGVAGSTNDLRTVRISLNPALQNVRLADVLDAVVKAADRPIKYAILEKAIEFSARHNEPTGLLLRTFKVDPNTFVEGLRHTFPDAFSTEGKLGEASAVTIQQAVRDFFQKTGVDLSPGTGKSVFFNDRQGMLLVRATWQDLDVIEAAIQALNTAPLQINLQAKFVEVTGNEDQEMSVDGFMGSTWLGTVSTTNHGSASPATPAAIRELPGDQLDWLARSVTNASQLRVTAALKGEATGILTAPQYRSVLRALESRTGADIVSTPQVTTLSGRQAQVKVEERRSIAMRINPEALVRAGAPAPTAPTGPAIVTEPMDFGPSLDVVPTVMADGYTVDLTVIVRVTEFLGYDPPPGTGKVRVWQDGQESLVTEPAPHLRVREMQSHIRVWDGQTLVLCGPTVEQAPAPKAAAATPGQATKKRLLVFITPTIIDPAGNRLHTDEDMPFTRAAVPQQQRLTPP